MRAWEEFIQKQEQELGKETVDKWLRTLKIIRYDACNLHLEAQDSFQLHWFEEHLRKKVNDQLFNNNRKKIRVYLSFKQQPQPPHVPQQKASRPVPHSSAAPHEFRLFFDELDAQCSFENYLPSQSNELTYKALYQVVNAPDHLGEYNPIFIYGGKGTGKTHLLMACTHAFKKQGLKVIYCRANTFTNHVVSAIRSGEMIKFRQAYRHIDVLIVDDVHVFSGKGATQEEFFHTFNTLHLSGKQIILSANCLPGELQEVEPRLVSRFEWGIVLGLNEPNLEEKKEILQHKCHLLDYKLNPKVADFLLETFSSHTTAWIRALNALVLRTHLNEKNGIRVPPPNTVPLAKEYLADLIKEEERAAITSEKIIQSVSAHFGITADDIVGKSQVRECVLPRQLAMYICRTELKTPFTKIGTLFSRDHSTVMSSIKQIQKGIDAQNDEITSALSSIQKRLC